jgi:hypothetical protein
MDDRPTKAGAEDPLGFSGFGGRAGGQNIGNAVGFYWTLPVPWAGFTTLPKAVDEAAKLSRMVRYQRDLIRRYARAEAFELVHEEVFLELYPDRASKLVLEPLRRVKSICETRNAILALSRFLGGREVARPRLLKTLAQGGRDRYASHSSRPDHRR